MKNKDYYEILGVAPHVGSGQIQAAYRFARSLYMGESTSSYGLLDAQERAQMSALVEEAYAALSSPSSRRDYDLQKNVRREGSGAAMLGAEGAPDRSPAKAAGRRPTIPAPPELTPLPGAAVEPLRVPELVNGAALRALRESRSLSIDQIAALSKVGGRFLKALEEDRHDALPGRVFARGFLIEYARAIRASETEIVDRYLRHWHAK